VIGNFWLVSLGRTNRDFNLKDHDTSEFTHLTQVNNLSEIITRYLT